mmetsp:Transcript_32792/g.103801  ORF Transcript_32792/g.103801 Transcript_32792/m.103801 type:complete len:469 (-) Transcript_32792:24-1430(-)
MYLQRRAHRLDAVLVGGGYLHAGDAVAHVALEQRQPEATRRSVDAAAAAGGAHLVGHLRQVAALLNSEAEPSLADHARRRKVTGVAGEAQVHGGLLALIRRGHDLQPDTAVAHGALRRALAGRGEDGEAALEVLVEEEGEPVKQRVERDALGVGRRVLEQRHGAPHDAGVDGGHEVHDAEGAGGEVVARPEAPAAHVVLVELTADRVPPLEKVGVHHLPHLALVLRHALHRRCDGAARRHAAHGMHHGGHVLRPTREEPLGVVQGGEGAEVEGRRVVACGDDDARAELLRRLVPVVDHLALPQRLAAEVRVVDPELRADFHEDRAVLGVRPHGGNDGRRGPHQPEDLRRVPAVRHLDAEVLAGLAEALLQLLQLLLGAPPEPHAHAPARHVRMVREVLGAELPGEAGGAVDEEVVGPIRCIHLHRYGQARLIAPRQLFEAFLRLLRPHDVEVNVRWLRRHGQHGQHRD